MITRKVFEGHFVNFFFFKSFLFNFFPKYFSKKKFPPPFFLNPKLLNYKNYTKLYEIYKIIQINYTKIIRYIIQKLYKIIQNKSMYKNIENILFIKQLIMVL